MYKELVKADNLDNVCQFEGRIYAYINITVVQYSSASLSINPAFRAGACTDCEYIECTIAITIIVILVRSLYLVY